MHDIGDRESNEMEQKCMRSRKTRNQSRFYVVHVLSPVSLSHSESTSIYKCIANINTYVAIYNKTVTKQKKHCISSHLLEIL